MNKVIKKYRVGPPAHQKHVLSDAPPGLQIIIRISSKMTAWRVQFASSGSKSPPTLLAPARPRATHQHIICFGPPVQPEPTSVHAPALPKLHTSQIARK